MSDQNQSNLKGSGKTVEQIQQQISKHKYVPRATMGDKGKEGDAQCRELKSTDKTSGSRAAPKGSSPKVAATAHCEGCEDKYCPGLDVSEDQQPAPSHSSKGSSSAREAWLQRNAAAQPPAPTAAADTVEQLSDLLLRRDTRIEELLADLERVKAQRDRLLAACKGALAHIWSGDLTEDMALKRLRSAIAAVDDLGRAAAEEAQCALAAAEKGDLIGD